MSLNLLIWTNSFVICAQSALFMVAVCHTEKRTLREEYKDRLLMFSAESPVRKRPRQGENWQLIHNFHRLSHPTSLFPVINLKQNKCTEAETMVMTFWLDCDTLCLHSALLVMMPSSPTSWLLFGSMINSALLLLFWNYGLCQARLHFSVTKGPSFRILKNQIAKCYFQEISWFLSIVQTWPSVFISGDKLPWTDI